VTGSAAAHGTAGGQCCAIRYAMSGDTAGGRYHTAAGLAWDMLWTLYTDYRGGSGRYVIGPGRRVSGSTVSCEVSQSEENHRYRQQVKIGPSTPRYR
jgi:hypothetical protein